MIQTSIIEIQKQYENDFSKSFIGSYFKTEERARQHFCDKLKSKSLFLIFENSKMAGFFNYYYQYSLSANYLEDIYVGKNFRRKGYSTHLLSKYIEISKHQITKNTVALSSTHLTNESSQKMHLSFGFKEIGVLKNLHYGEDEIFYAFTLE